MKGGCRFFEPEGLRGAAFRFCPTDLQKVVEQFILNSFSTAVQLDSSVIRGAE